MKHIAFIIISFCLLSCSSHSTTNKQSTDKLNNADFSNYIESLNFIKLPLEFYPEKDVENIPKEYDSAGFAKFKHNSSLMPLGILIKDSNFIATIDISIGDIAYVPFIVSYRNDGTKIDSTSLYDKTGDGFGYSAVEHITINVDKSIMVIDTVKMWNEDENSLDSDVNRDSIQMTIDTVYYYINKQGQIIKQ